MPATKTAAAIVMAGTRKAPNEPVQESGSMIWLL
jgi:hypothetical protein